MPEIKRVYVCGPISPRGTGDLGIEHLGNLRAGIKAGKELIRLGFSPYNPFLDPPYWLIDDDPLTGEEIRSMDMDWVEVSDAVLALPGWQDSKGALAEIEVAAKYRIPIFTSIDGLVEYRND